MSTPISIKGTKDGLRLVLDEDASWADILTTLRTQLERGAEFFRGAELTLDVGNRALQAAELNMLLDLMREHGLQPAVLATNAPEGRSAGRVSGVATRPSTRLTQPMTSDTEVEDAMLVVRTLRSGQMLRHHGHIILIGDVNPGAQIVAGGSVIVWGRLRGTVHAGALGDRTAVVCAIDLQPSLLRIADLLSRTPEQQRSEGPEIARVDGHMIVVSLWDEVKFQ
ncbi:MAG: septum site-determining protein MinC [Chloroflexota bacterium]|nr:septum site-determining protein MinC [Chloroflexota bacterium]